jgi:hypothetical protein
MKKRDVVRAAVAEALCDHFDSQRLYSGDMFATEAELANLKDDPIGNIDLLDYPVRQMVRRILEAGDALQEQGGQEHA